MIFDREKNESIKQLKKLRQRKDKGPYKEMKRAIMKKFDVSGRTVEYWLKQRTPGVRKSRSDSGKKRSPILPKQKRLTKELLDTGMPIKDVKKIVAAKTGKPISNRKLNRVREQIDTAADKEQFTNEQIVKSMVGEAAPDESNFGDAAKELFRKLFDMDLIAPERGVGLLVNGKRFVIPKEDLEDICLILANAYNRTGQARFKVDRKQLLRQRIMHLIEQQVRLATTERVDSKTIAQITLMFDRMVEQVKYDADIHTVEKVCKELKPDISFTEICALIEKHSTEDGN